MNEVLRKKKKNKKRLPDAKKSKSANESIPFELSKLVSGLGQLTKKAYQAYLPIVDNIVNNESRDTQEIEHTLDGLLNFCFDKKMLILFKKLCRHYYYIDSEATAVHVYAYRDMWDEESINNETEKKSNPKSSRISAIEREQLRMLKKPAKKLMLDE